MNFSAEMTWAQWTQATGQTADQIETVMQNGYDVWRKFYALTYGKSDAQILTLPAFTGKAQSDLDAIRSCLNTFKTLHDAYRGNAALSQYDYSGYLIPFQG